MTIGTNSTEVGKHNMQAVQTQFNIHNLQASWQAFDAMVHLRPIQTEADFERLSALMNTLLDDVGDDEDHPLSGLLELITDLIYRYEQTHHSIEAAEPKDVLRFLIESRGLKQDDLSSIIPQSNLSAILAGKRKISAVLAGKLGKYFGISAAVFVPA
jgi:HTH-type transcriptional regulator / antitoxin HigA